MAVLGVRQRDLDDLRAQAGHHLQRRADGRLDLRLHALDEIFPRHAHAQPLQAVADVHLADVIRHRHVRLVESRGSWPAMTPSSMAASSTSRASGPIWSSDEAKATSP